MGKKLIDFHAEWCGPCKKQDKILEKLKEEIDDSFEVEFEKVDIDEDRRKADENGVTSVPTIVIEEDGEEVERFVGITSKKKLKESLK